MGRINKKKSEGATKDYKEFKVDGKCFQYTGRLYTEAKETAKSNRYFVYLCINSGITIQCHLVVTDDNSFISWPSWIGKDKKSKSYIYTDECMNDDLDKLSEELEKLL